MVRSRVRRSLIPYMALSFLAVLALSLASRGIGEHVVANRLNVEAGWRGTERRGAQSKAADGAVQRQPLAGDRTRPTRRQLSFDVQPRRGAIRSLQEWIGRTAATTRGLVALSGIIASADVDEQRLSLAAVANRLGNEALFVRITRALTAHHVAREGQVPLALSEFVQATTGDSVNALPSWVYREGVNIALRQGSAFEGELLLKQMIAANAAADPNTAADRIFANYWLGRLLETTRGKSAGEPYYAEAIRIVNSTGSIPSNTGAKLSFRWIRPICRRSNPGVTP